MTQSATSAQRKAAFFMVLQDSCKAGMRLVREVVHHGGLIWTKKWANWSAEPRSADPSGPFTGFRCPDAPSSPAGLRFESVCRARLGAPPPLLRRERVDPRAQGLPRVGGLAGRSRVAQRLELRI